MNIFFQIIVVHIMSIGALTWMCTNFFFKKLFLPLWCYSAAEIYSPVWCCGTVKVGIVFWGNAWEHSSWTLSVQYRNLSLSSIQIYYQHMKEFWHL